MMWPFIKKEYPPVPPIHRIVGTVSGQFWVEYYEPGFTESFHYSRMTNNFETKAEAQKHIDNITEKDVQS